MQQNGGKHQIIKPSLPYSDTSLLSEANATHEDEDTDNEADATIEEIGSDNDDEDGASFDLPGGGGGDTVEE